jgi:molybdate transport system ATP-binding protein
LLKDEPVSALDQASKQDILPYLKRLHRALSIPVLYVSHALDEVARIADHMLLINAGRVLAAGPLAELLTRLDLPLAHGDTAEAVVEAQVVEHDGVHQLIVVAFPGGQFILPHHPVAIGQRVRVRVQARDVSLTLEPQQDTSILNILPARVTALSDDQPGQVMVGIEVGETALLARITCKSAGALRLAPGVELYAQVKGVALLE